MRHLAVHVDARTVWPHVTLYRASFHRYEVLHCIRSTSAVEVVDSIKQGSLIRRIQQLKKVVSVTILSSSFDRADATQKRGCFSTSRTCLNHSGTRFLQSGRRRKVSAVCRALLWFSLCKPLCVVGVFLFCFSSMVFLACHSVVRLDATTACGPPERKWSFT